MPSIRTLTFVALIATAPLWVKACLQQVADLSTHLFPSEQHRPMTEERMVELLEKSGPLFRQVMTAPPYCWGYTGSRRVWPEQGQWTEDIFKEFMASKAKREKVWLDAVGKEPPLTCEEYERY
jgi:hypothetical protein